MLENDKKQKSETEFAVMGCVKAAMLLKDCTSTEINSYVNNATSGDINNLIEVSNEQLKKISSNKKNILYKIVKFFAKTYFNLKGILWIKK